jgi:hypothetical protein
LVAIVYSCSEAKPTNGDTRTAAQFTSGAKQKDKGEKLANATTEATAPGCNAALWKRVYSPKRLQIVDECKVVTGVISELNVEEDGDEHMLLKLDPGQDALVNKRNIKKKDGDLVLEIVCANPTTKKSPSRACAGFTNAISFPALHQRVKVTGSYVLDSHNGWMEIHPVSSIEVLR